MKRLVVKNSRGKVIISLFINIWMALLLLCVLDVMVVLLIVGVIYKWSVTLEDEK
jgi:ABC-type transport system involved in multi-copper enzyme maturation permease subunit